MTKRSLRARDNNTSEAPWVGTRWIFCVLNLICSDNIKWLLTLWSSIVTEWLLNFSYCLSATWHYVFLLLTAAMLLEQCTGRYSAFARSFKTVQFVTFVSPFLVRLLSLVQFCWNLLATMWGDKKLKHVLIYDIAHAKWRCLISLNL